jgi:ribonuclease HI
VDTGALLELLRQLANAQPGPKVLYLPAGLSPEAAIQAVRAAVRALDPTPPRQRTGTGPRVTRVHIDGASRGNPGPAGVGILFLAPDGTVIERMHRGIGEATNNVAEYSALLTALERATELGLDELEVYSDSELLVRQLQGRYQVKHPALRPLYATVQQRIGALRRFAIHHVPRELNAEADLLANQGIDDASKSAGLRSARRDHREDE